VEQRVQGRTRTRRGPDARPAPRRLRGGRGDRHRHLGQEPGCRRTA
jgi:hypothetical protein